LRISLFTCGRKLQTLTKLRFFLFISLPLLITGNRVPVKENSSLSRNNNIDIAVKWPLNCWSRVEDFQFIWSISLFYYNPSLVNEWLPTGSHIGDNILDSTVYITNNYVILFSKWCRSPRSEWLFARAKLEPQT
jgi:hypothetical protein